jgi:hypothetical protein
LGTNAVHAEIKVMVGHALQFFIGYREPILHGSINGTNGRNKTA